jgi:hypothetical protein
MLLHQIYHMYRSNHRQEYIEYLDLFIGAIYMNYDIGWGIQSVLLAHFD